MLKPVMAELKKDEDTLTKQDPYVIFFVGSQKLKSHTSMGGGKTPSWKDVFNVRKTTEDSVRVEVWDKDFLSRDDFLGEGMISMQSLMGTGRFTNWIPLSHKGRNSGKLLIESEFTSDAPKTLPKTDMTLIQQGYPQQMSGGSDPYNKVIPTQMPMQQQQPMGGFTGYPQQMSGYPQQQMGGFPQQPMMQGGFPQQQMGGFPQQQMGGFPQQQMMQGGYPQQQMQGGFPQQQFGGQQGRF